MTRLFEDSEIPLGEGAVVLRGFAGEAGLLQDLKQRGLLDSTLVVWAGEFGRTG